jgi:hypothetical protein
MTQLTTPRLRGHPVQRGEFYRLKNPHRDPKDQRVYLVVSRQAFIDTSHSSVIAVPAYPSPTGFERKSPSARNLV